MKITTLKDLKVALNKVPDNILVHFGVASTDDDIMIGDLDWNEDTDLAAKHFDEANKYKSFKLIDKYFDKLREAFRDDDFCEDVHAEIKSKRMF